MEKRPGDSRRDQTSQQKSGHSGNSTSNSSNSTAGINSNSSGISSNSTGLSSITVNGNSSNSRNHYHHHHHAKKSKRRGSKKGNGNLPQPGELGHCVDSRQQQGQQQQFNSQQKGYVSVPSNSAAQLEYGKIYWQQSPVQQQLLATQNGQRLFTAVSDPTVCGYSPMPLTYAMEPVSLPPMYQLYQPVPRPSYHSYRGRPRHNHAQGASGISGGKIPMPFNYGNGYANLHENNVGYSTGIGYQNGDYASLPPAANIENGVTAQELGCEHRRYSDPGLGPLQIPKIGKSDDSESMDSASSVTTIERSSKLVLSLIEQVTALKGSNSQLFRELHQTKAELETVKMELNRLKQSSFADYQPGMLSDIVREMREAAKVREESLISKVKSMMNEKQPFSSIPDTATTELDELKNQLARITDEKTETEVRLAKVEQELAALKSSANDEGQEIVALEEETLALRRELQEARASRNKAQNQASKCVVKNAEVAAASPRPVTPDNHHVTKTKTKTTHNYTTVTQPSQLPQHAAVIISNTDHVIAPLPSQSKDTDTDPDTDPVTDFSPIASKSCENTPPSIENALSKFKPVFDEEIGADFPFFNHEIDDNRYRESVEKNYCTNDDREEKILDKNHFTTSTSTPMKTDGSCNNDSAVTNNAIRDVFDKCIRDFNDQEFFNNETDDRKSPDIIELKEMQAKNFNANDCIDDIPEVAVVDGKSFGRLNIVKKPACSVRIINSKGLKPPPTKATYTTAYI
ncbi:uncharacterized protein LOC124414058 isoform X2 [Diprion similis]|uniref:uncharacterized protein LOC124414058 isoform X2 n=1 Tax=Diprion similis TaxID=362088 RepID=UPI001EF8D41F|nr:uncharacterized protein LOC124414058 isoform X2 [Diprion similis]